MQLAKLTKQSRLQEVLSGHLVTQLENHAQRRNLQGSKREGCTSQGTPRGRRFLARREQEDTSRGREKPSAGEITPHRASFRNEGEETNTFPDREAELASSRPASREIPRGVATDPAVKGAWARPGDTLAETSTRPDPGPRTAERRASATHSA